MVMKKTNIMVEVDNQLYETVVAPHKRNKTFSKLVSTLIDGYAKDEYVRAYAEGTLDEIQAESVSALDDVIEGMQGSLADMGLFTNELKNTTQAGAEMMSKRSFRQEGFGGMGVSGNAGLAEVSQSQEESQSSSELKETVEELKAQNKEILSMLEKLMSSGMSVTSSSIHSGSSIGETVEKVIAKPEVKEEPAKPAPVPVRPIVHPVEVPEVEEESSSVDASDVMSQLLNGNMMSF